jgi:hypothetical protein
MELYKSNKSMFNYSTARDKRNFDKLLKEKVLKSGFPLLITKTIN